MCISTTKNCSNICSIPRNSDFNLPFLVQTDASEISLGVVLSQIFGDEESPIYIYIYSI